SKESAWKWIENNSEHFIEISDKIWELAELGLVEYESSELLAKTLEENGFHVDRGVADMPTAFVATFENGGPTIGIMGEYDALPGISQNAVPYKDPTIENGPGHGCGHNIHGTSGMGAAIALKNEIEQSNLKGTVKFFGTPAEETYSGKVFMVRAGLFDGVDTALSHHPYHHNLAGLGSSLAMNSAKFHFYGKASHAAASPDRGKSALDAVELMNIGVNFMREHIVQDARIHYVIEDGGLQPNVVPPYARSWYYIRAPERDQVDEIYPWVLKIAEGANMMARTEYKVEFIEGLYNTLPSKSLSVLVTSNMREIGNPKYTDEEMEFAKEIDKSVPRKDKIAALRQSKRPGWEKLVEEIMDNSILDAWDEGEVIPGSTDVGDVSWVTPTMEFYTATSPIAVQGHTWQDVACNGMGIGHKSLIFATKVLAGAGLEILTKPELLKSVKQEFKERLAGRKYKSPIPDEIKPPVEMAKEAAKTAGQS
ncbi:MAG: amidohydrolase, partial [Candidatus Thorarchaeota archaeon]|nr:amidohydrolase [Candidatus Thorarchaeota archaeon]